MASPSEPLMAGGFLGDFVKGRLTGNYTYELEQGIRLHRYIDSYTDRHIALREIRMSIPEEFRRYSGIVSDLLCDHYLSLNWNDFSNDDLAVFNDAAVSCLRSYQSDFPISANRVLDRMANSGWLLNYHRIEFVCGALSRIGQRFNHKNPLHTSADQLPALCETLLPLCGHILHDCQDAVAKWRAANN